MKPFIQTAIESGEILHEDIADILENVKRTPTRKDEEGQIVHEHGVYTTTNGNTYLLYRNTIERQEPSPLDNAFATDMNDLDESPIKDGSEITYSRNEEVIYKGTIQPTGENDGNLTD